MRRKSQEKTNGGGGETCQTSTAVLMCVWRGGHSYQGLSGDLRPPTTLVTPASPSNPRPHIHTI